MEKIPFEQETQDLLEAERERRSVARRDLLRGLSVGAVAALGGFVVSGCKFRSQQQQHKQQWQQRR